MEAPTAATRSSSAVSTADDVQSKMLDEACDSPERSGLFPEMWRATENPISST